MNRVERWIIDHTGALVPIVTVLTVGLTVVVIWLATLEVDDRSRLGDVQVVGPCRTFGPDDPECRRQSRLIVESCLTHTGCLKVVNRFMDNLQRVGVQPRQKPSEGARGGGNDSPAPAPSEQPGPSGGQGDEPKPPPSQPPPPPEPDCVINALGLCVQLPV